MHKKGRRSMSRFVHFAAIFLFSILYIFFIPPEPQLFKIIMKLVPMLLIILLAIKTPVRLSHTFKKFLLLGLFICMIADAVIYWFLPGLLTFFVGHLVYIFAFHRLSRKPMSKLVGFLLLLYGCIMAFWLAGTQLKADQTVLAFAIIAYIIVILIMGWTAIQTRLPLVIFGALLFIFSDSILAIDWFVQPIEFRDALVMFTYYGAQFLFALSIGSRVGKYSANKINLIR